MDQHDEEAGLEGQIPATTTGAHVQVMIVLAGRIGVLRCRLTRALVSPCAAQQSGDLGSSAEAVDGILGLGQSNSSMLSQLASAGKTRKIFSHCLDTVEGGGIFAIGSVVQPKVK
ncbi:Aspartic proteinase-like protein 2 [Platanthera zijinensis]|uniref:Aspartic proteinase-like protein 2 n=1 Tax=Platanthera zijinensis TaxID=2320716 RepID=A0AAP0BGC5_9ASPA